MNPTYIELAGYLPDRRVYIRTNAILAITDNEINPNSKGAIIYTSSPDPFLVREEPEAILKLIGSEILLKP